jgi:hypothetical protein
LPNSGRDGLSVAGCAGDALGGPGGKETLPPSSRLREAKASHNASALSERQTKGPARNTTRNFEIDL